MKPLHVILLMIVAAIVGGIGVKLALKPVPPAIPPPAVPQAAAAVPEPNSIPAEAGPVRKTPAKPARKPEPTVIPAPRQVNVALPGIALPNRTDPFNGSSFNREPVGVFTGVDPSDPRVFHFAEN